jgi:hypothetical protein
MSVVVPFRPSQRNEVDHPKWCSPKHCQIEEQGRVHESAPVEIFGLTLIAHQAAAPADGYAMLTIDTKPDGSGQTISLRLGRAPDLARALLDLFCGS